MALISTEDAKAYLRVDSSDEDATVGILLASAIRLCIDIARLTDDQWEVIDSDAASSDEYTEAELSAIRETMKVAILYTCAYLFEHREEADHHALTMTLRQEIGQTQRFCLDAQFFREQVCSLHIADAEQ